MKNRHLGSNFDDFLKEEGLFAEAEAIAVKRALVFQIQQAMKMLSLTKSTMAKRMHTSRASLNRLLDPENTSITLQTLAKVAVVIGKRIDISIK